ncbi:MAG: DUF4337 domain-containing protein [Burkholderiales bacterium]|nr:MAG: DUF4337 domain-containing protein [Burkholderiales bacterium]
MSGNGFHVHGPHDHELEHAAQHEPKGFAGQLAVITAILATVGAFFSYMGGATQANAALYKNDAAIKKTEASNQWNYYQAKSSKQNLAELALDLSGNDDQKAKYRDKVARYEKEKAEIKEKAEALEAESKHFDELSEAQMHQHHRWAQATTALQVSIAVAAIALLTKRRWMEWATILVGGAGCVWGGLAAAHII